MIFICYVQILKGKIKLEDGTEVPLQEFIDRPEVVFYIGITGQDPMTKEDLGFMLRRGAMVRGNKFGKRCTDPPLLKPNGDTIPASELRGAMGFKSFELAEFGLYFNACRVETAVQKAYKQDQKKAFGSKILWTVSGAGGTTKYKEWDVKNADAGQPRVVKLFVTYSVTALAKIARGAYIVNQKRTRSNTRR